MRPPPRIASRTPPRPVTAEVVENHAVSRSQDRNQATVHIGPKHLPVYRSVRDHGRDQLPPPQRTTKVVVCRALGKPLHATRPPMGAPIAPRHVRRSPRFIYKYQLFEVPQKRVMTPRAARLPHVVALLLAGVQGVF